MHEKGRRECLIVLAVYPSWLQTLQSSSVDLLIELDGVEEPKRLRKCLWIVRDVLIARLCPCRCLTLLLPSRLIDVVAAEVGVDNLRRGE